MKAYRIRIELVDSNPLVWRRVMIPAGATFYRLFDTIQCAMGWLGNSLEEYHLYEFDIAEENLRITNDEEAIEDSQMMKAKLKGKSLDKIMDPFGELARHLKQTVKNSKSLKIDAFLEKYKQLQYTYDFGDNWQHQIILEAVFEDYPFGYPVLLDGEGDCPPEDVGGWIGYQAFLKIYNNPSHKNHKSTAAWAQEQRYKPFDPIWTNVRLKCIKIAKTDWKAMGLGDGHYDLSGHETDKYK